MASSESKGEPVPRMKPASEAPGAPEPPSEASETPSEASETPSEASETPSETPEQAREAAMVRRAVRNLSVCSLFALAPSPLHGVGVFATKDIAAGTKTDLLWPVALRVGSEQIDRLPAAARATIGRVFPHARDLLPANGGHQLSVGSFLNHANRPNALLDEEGRLEVVTAVRGGHEILIDYRASPGWEHLLPASRTARRGRRGRARGRPPALPTIVPPPAAQADAP